MTKTDKQLLEILESIEGSGSFMAAGKLKFASPQLYVQGVGAIGFPLNELLVKEMIKVGHKAPFGKGSKTVTDTNVRSAWELAPQQLSFKSNKWEQVMAKILKKVQKKLGLKDKLVEATLYKLLIYEEGDFFLAHKDSEKASGMFGTLIVGLPMAHTGGELVVRFNGKEELISFAQASETEKIPFAAFYADCEHELKPVTSGYRICLVYNLIQKAAKNDTAIVNTPQFDTQTEELTAILKKWKNDKTQFPKIVLLGHDYTPKNFSFDNLKLDDRPRAKALFEAAERTDYVAKLGLVTHYLMGDLEYETYNRRSRWDYDEYGSGEGGKMGEEIHEQYTQIEHWEEEGDTPGLGTIVLDDDDIITSSKIGGGDPTDKYEEGYTGNAGMTMEYWYHYGAMILWPIDRHIDLINEKSLDLRINWLSYYLQNWEKPSLKASDNARNIILSISDKEWREIEFNTGWNTPTPPDYNILANTLLKLGEVALLENAVISALLPNVFHKIEIQNWVSLFLQFSPEYFTNILKNATQKDNLTVILHHLQLVIALAQQPIYQKEHQAFINQEINRIPKYLLTATLHKEKEQEEEAFNPYTYLSPKEEEDKRLNLSNIITQLLQISTNYIDSADWENEIGAIFTQNLSRDYVNEVLTPTVIKHKKLSNTLYQSLYEAAHTHLRQRVDNEPKEPQNWTRPIPKYSSYQKAQWEILIPFLQSPTKQIFDYRKSQRYRSAMESAISSATVDLKMETIKKGSPHILRLTKTQASYEKEVKEWLTDIKLLHELAKSSGK